MNRFNTLGFALLVFVLATAAFGQTAMYVGAGPSLYSTAPYGAGNLAIGICNTTGSTCSLTGFEARGSVKDPAHLVYSTSTGVRQVVATASSPTIKVEVFGLAQGGAAVTGSAVGPGGHAGRRHHVPPGEGPQLGFYAGGA